MAQLFEVKFTGIAEAETLYARAGAQAGPVLGRTLRELGEGMMRVSQVQVPFRFGPLKASGRVTGPTVKGNDIQVELSYGNTAVAYALYQHEGQRADGTHKIRNYHYGKKKHYLSDPVNAGVGLLGPLLARRVEELFEGRS